MEYGLRVPDYAGVAVSVLSAYALIERRIKPYAPLRHIPDSTDEHLPIVCDKEHALYADIIGSALKHLADRPNMTVAFDARHIIQVDDIIELLGVCSFSGIGDACDEGKHLLIKHRNTVFGVPLHTKHI